MRNIVVYALLATYGCNAAEIRRRQQAISIAPPRVIIPGGGTGAALNASPVQNYYAKPGSSPIPANMGNQNIVIPNSMPPVGGPTVWPSPGPGNMAAPLGQGPMGGPSQSAPQSGPGQSVSQSGPPDQSAPQDGQDQTSPPGDFGPAPLNSDGLQLPPDDSDVPPPAVDQNTVEAVAALSDPQRDDLLASTDAAEFGDGSEEFQELMLQATKDKLTTISSEVQAQGLDLTEDIEAPETAPSVEIYSDIQDLGTNVTEKSQMLSETMQQLLDVALDEVRNNETLDATEVQPDGTVVKYRKDKRWLLAIISTLSLIYEGAKLAADIYDTGARMYKTFKETNNGANTGPVSLGKAAKA
ncbi:hypothetical protein H072_1686 [Dactylellina haptotyla CBS 200.50]|uniref:Uncharacterized protein n=1 Tax=Dactylellina haptotyla (strain CBS 200.50) TaxID=1284197 RepID=S8C9P4_DACHA|nr:hypothetical protein H072_1686 [Dactylellina haptotyla CBS 200.50]